MGNDGWVPLWRKSIKNKVRRHDPSAWRLFETLLLIVDHKTGKWDGGRYQLSDLDGSLKPATSYKALLRLQTAKMVTLSSNNKYTTISICNWERYSGFGNTSSNNKVTTRSHSNNNKQLTSTYSNSEQPHQTFFKQKTNKAIQGKYSLQVTNILQLFTDSTGGSFGNALHADAVEELIKLHGYDGVMEMANFGLSLPPKKFQVEINKPVDLGDHWQKLLEIRKGRKDSDELFKY